MTDAELRIEHRHIYDTRLGMMGLGRRDMPTSTQHNQAVEEADDHIAALQGIPIQREWKTLREFAENL